MPPPPPPPPRHIPPVLRLILLSSNTTPTAASTSGATQRLFSSTSTSTSSPPPRFTFPFVHPSSSSSSSSRSKGPDFDTDAVAASFKEWFRNPSTLFDQIYYILSSVEDISDLNSSLSCLRLRLDNSFVLRVLRHQPRLSPPLNPDGSGNNVLLLRLKFFDWAGRQPQYQHTPATYFAIFKLLSRARLVSVIVDWLNNFSEARHRQILFLHCRHFRFHETLVVGYAVAGKTDTALQMFGKMRFQGIDLDAFSYHVLFNALVEESTFDVANSVLAQITDRGHTNPVTAYIHIKSLCKQGRLDEAKAFLFGELNGAAPTSAAADRAVGIVVDTLCRMRRFEEASSLVEEFGGARSYAVWLKNLIASCRLDGAIDFIRCKRVSEGYVPEVFSYNKLICQLLHENHLKEVYDVLVEMREDGIMPNQVTMNAALCFFCKAGMVDVALQLYNSRLDFGLTPNSLAFNHMINALCGDGSIDEACHVLEESMRQGYFPGKQTFRLLADVLCREGKLDKMGKLLDAALQRNTMPISTACARYVSALCKAGRTEEGYLVVSQKATDTSIPLSRHAYVCLIHGFITLKRVDMICRLLMEMKENGHFPSQKLFRDIICCLCEMGHSDKVLNLLDIQLSRQGLDRRTCYNFFIDGFGHARKPELARLVLERMLQEGIEANMDTKVLMLQSYLKGQRISDALNFFNDLNAGREPSKRLYNMLIAGLCKAGRPDQALLFWDILRRKNLIPSLHCYEELVYGFCSCGNYLLVVKVLQDFEETGRPISPFLCNILLLHTLKTQEFQWAWIQAEAYKKESGSQSSRPLLGDLVAAFSGGIRMKQHLDNLEAVVEKFFPVNIYTYNMLMRALAMAGRMDYACDLFHRICRKGYVPNRWTYDIIVHGFCKNGLKKDANIWMEEMYQNGFYPTWYTMDLFNKTLEE